MRLLFIATLAALLFISCKPQDSQTKNVFGADDRKAWKDVYQPGSFPFHSIGIVYHEENNSIKTCTATLVAPEVILTAAHCVFDKGRKLVNFKYIPYGRNEVQGRFLAAGNKGQIEADDWALVEITPAQADKPFKIGDGTTTLAGKRMNLAGFSSDLQNLSVHQDCQVTKDDTKVAYYDCDMRSGASGGPLFYEEGGELVIGAVNSAEKLCGEEKCPDGVVYGSVRANLGAKITSQISKMINAVIGEVSGP